MSRHLETASPEYCERCRCRTQHVLLPSGERVCEWHLEASPPPAPPRQQEAQS